MKQVSKAEAWKVRIICGAFFHEQTSTQYYLYLCEGYGESIFWESSTNLARFIKGPEKIKEFVSRHKAVNLPAQQEVPNINHDKRYNQEIEKPWLGQGQGQEVNLFSICSHSYALQIEWEAEDSLENEQDDPNQQTVELLIEQTLEEEQELEQRSISAKVDSLLAGDEATLKRFQGLPLRIGFSNGKKAASLSCKFCGVSVNVASVEVGNDASLVGLVSIKSLRKHAHDTRCAGQNAPRYSSANDDTELLIVKQFDKPAFEATVRNVFAKNVNVKENTGEHFCFEF